MKDTKRTAAAEPAGQAKGGQRHVTQRIRMDAEEADMTWV